MHQYRFFPLLLLLSLLSLNTYVNAQKTLLMPVRVKTYDQTTEDKLKKGATIIDKYSAIVNRKVDSTEYKKMVPAINRSAMTFARKNGKKLIMATQDELSDETKQELESLTFVIYFAQKSKGMLIGRKNYEDKLSNQLAPLINGLCDQFDADQVLFTTVTTVNRRKKYREKGKDPAGQVSASAILFDGDSALVLDKKAKIKGKTKDLGSGININNNVSLLPKEVAEYFQGLLKSVL